MDVRHDIVKNPSTGLCFKVLERSMVAYLDGSSEAAERHSEKLNQAVKAGRVFEIGSMDYDTSMKTAVNGLRILRSGLVDWPFSTSFVVVSKVTFSPEVDQERIIATADLSTPGVIRVSECAVTKQNYILCFSVADFELDEDSFTVTPKIDSLVGEFGIRPDAGNYVVPFNVCLSLLSIVNTRGVEHRKRPAKKKKSPVVHVFKTGEYFTAMKSDSRPHAEGDKSRKGPRPHVRRGHVRTFSDGRKIWIRDTLVGTRSEDDISWEERRISYI